MTILRTALAAVVLLGISTAGALASNSGRSDTMTFGKSTDCAAAHEKFQRTYFPVFFGVAEGGKMCVYSYCAAACRTSNARSLTIYRCEKESGTTCQLYDQNDPIPGLTSN
ncbi:MAG: hypothetical protein QNJ67_07840 [Kiloniellales bacterium]|nr:hypothetical protein [Kiloniellales bacterium]